MGSLWPFRGAFQPDSEKVEKNLEGFPRPPSPGCAKVRKEFKTS